MRNSAKCAAELFEARLMLSGSPIWVTNTHDSGPGSLRTAIDTANAAPGEDTVRFRPAARGTIELSSQLVITDDLLIDGPGASRLTISGEDATRVFLVLPAELADDPFVTPSQAVIDSAPDVTIRDVTIADGLSTDAPGYAEGGPFAFGGGLYNLGGTVELVRVEFTGNTASGLVTAGGAIANEFGGTLNISRSEFAGNSSDGVLIGAGGAITSDLGATAEAVSFSVEGSGNAPQGVPLPGQEPRPHDIEGTFTIGGTTLTHTGMGMVQTDTADLMTLTGEFGSAAPFVFTDSDGDSLVTQYGRTEFGAAEPGFFKLTVRGPAEGGLNVLVQAHWIAEFVVQPDSSTGKYAGVTGSWIMDAYSDPFVLGTSEPLDYRWESREGAELRFPSQSGQPEVHIDRSSFVQNSASAQLGHFEGQAFSGLGGGGAILNIAGVLNVERSEFLRNTVTGGTGTGDAVSGGAGFGGAINSSDVSPFGSAPSELIVESSTFVSNSALGGSGGDTGLAGGPAGGGRDFGFQRRRRSVASQHLRRQPSHRWKRN
ncbi:MAG: hypothetical protein R3C19_24840 [Planctomycetaceae bacterium]